MNEAWFRVAGMAFGYASSLCALLVLLLALRRDAADRAAWRQVRRDTPSAGSACMFRVVSGGGRRLSEGQELHVPDEGTLGAAYSCDVCIPYRKVHLRSAFFWMERDGLHMAPLHRDGFQVDGVQANPGDEAILRDGAELRLGDLRLRLSMRTAGRETYDGPYVTRARRLRAGEGRGDGIGAPGRRERYAAARNAQKDAPGRGAAKLRQKHKAAAGGGIPEEDGLEKTGKKQQKQRGKRSGKGRSAAPESAAERALRASAGGQGDGPEGEAPRKGARPSGRSGRHAHRADHGAV